MRTQPSAETLLNLCRFFRVDAEWFYEWDDVDKALPDDYAELAERVREAISLLPLGGDALPLMIGATASDIVQAASTGRLTDDGLDLLGKLAGLRSTWIRTGQGDRHPPPQYSSRGQLYTRPLVGRIAAGTPVLAEENRLGWDQVENPSTVLTFEVQGDSMTGAGIMPGDHVGIMLVDPHEDDIKEQDVCALLITRDEDPDHRYIVLKPLRRTADGRLIAVSANPAYPPIILDDDDNQTVRFLGIVTELHRDYRAR